MPTATYPLPTVHLNGDSREELTKQAKFAHGALVDASKALCQMRPHPRNFYPQGGDAFQQAVAEYNRHMQALAEAIDYAMDHRIHLIDSQKGDRLPPWWPAAVQPPHRLRLGRRPLSVGH